MATNPWQRFFDEHAPKYLENVFTKNTLAEVDFLCELFKLPQGSSIIDIGCGTGRHAVELAKRGFQITGVDLSAGMLAEARKAADKAGMTVDWIQQDATKYRSDRLFDAAICLCEGAFGLLGQHDDPSTHELLILQNIYRVLKPGGRLVCTVLNALRFIRKCSPEDVQAGKFDPITLIETYEEEYDTLEGKKRMTLRERSFVPSELVLIFRQVGFDIENVWGGTAGNWGRRPVELDEMEIMIVARRPR